MRLEPGGHRLRVSADENVLSAALAAGIAIPHSCRAGRCASCRSTLVLGTIAYPAGTPPGITDAEIARGAVLLCQARPRSDLVVEARTTPAASPGFVPVTLHSVSALPMGALGVHVRQSPGGPRWRPGQFVDVQVPAGEVERLPVIASDGEKMSFECSAGGGAVRHWLDGGFAEGAVLQIAGPFDHPR